MRAFMLIVAVTSGVIAVGCGGSDCGEPEYEGGTQDEAFRAMVDAEKRTSVADARAVTVVFPAEGATFAKTSTPPTFSWSSPIRAANAPARFSPPKPNLWDRLRSLVISDAYAHGEPYTGDLYDVTIDVPGETCPVRVLTGRVTWTPSEALWRRLTATPGERKLSIVSAYMRDNRVTEGPYAPAADTSFRVEE